LSIALTPLYAQNSIAVLQSMQIYQNDIRANKKQAKELQRIGAINCIDRKQKLANRLRDMANSNYKKLNSAKKTNSGKSVQQQARIIDAGNKIKALALSMVDCWCNDKNIDNTGISISLNNKAVPLAKLCSELGSRDNLVTIEIPQGTDITLISVSNEEDLQGNFGFPEIPAASPFR
jgi:hypothetical protein